MKEMICIEVELKEFLKANKTEDVVIVRRNGKWVCDTISNLTKPMINKIQHLEDVCETYRLDNQEMKQTKEVVDLEIKKMKEALVFYGFKMFEGGKQ